MISVNYLHPYVTGMNVNWDFFTPTCYEHLSLLNGAVKPKLSTSVQ